ncbi:MAG: dihydropteroate synthase [Acidobacteria bacterium]|nr:dihydropteroate synthase [Acidobacteriota bacterium]
MRKPYAVPARSRILQLGGRTWIMGIINVTPDSFYSASRSPGVQTALEMARRMICQGADIVDVGGESTRPGSDPVPEQQELDRVIPVVEAICSSQSVPVSVDTRKASVARAALEAGAELINDISGFHGDSEMASVVAHFGAAAVVMHLRGTPKTMHRMPHSDDIFAEARAYLLDGMEKATRAGVSRDRIIMDPGLGFGKSPAENLQILRNLAFFRDLDRPILVGPSRKSFIGKVLQQEIGERLWGTAAAVACAVLAGAHIVRVHDVAEMKSVVKMADALASVEHG